VTVAPFYFDCAGCRAREDDGETVAMTLLSMLVNDDCTPESIVSDLCFVHRRRLHEAGLRMKREEGA